MLGQGLIHISTLLENYADINLHAGKAASERTVSFLLHRNKASSREECIEGDHFYL